MSLRLHAAARTRTKKDRFRHAGRMGLERLEDRRLLYAGELDLDFGQSGIARSDFGGTQEYISQIALRTDGSIIAAGSTNAAGNSDFAIARYDPNGALDQTFGGSGVAKVDIGGRDDFAAAVALQDDGSILVAGIAHGTGHDGDFALVKLGEDGQLDLTFGTNGIVTTDFFGFGDRVNAMAVQPDGKIILAGKARTSGTGQTDVFWPGPLQPQRGLGFDIWTRR